MRYDMYRVIIDSPRWGSSFYPNRKTRLHLSGDTVNSWSLEELEDYDSGPRKHPMTSRNKYADPVWQKSSSDRLGPLRQFLRSRVGRHWNDVHHEISRTLDNRSVVRGRHFWAHVFEEVKTNCFFDKGGKLYYWHRWAGLLEVYGLYVHPSTKVLCYRERA